jgi:hypothetical protein
MMLVWVASAIPRPPAYVIPFLTLISEYNELPVENVQQRLVSLVALAISETCTSSSSNFAQRAVYLR